MGDRVSTLGPAVVSAAVVGRLAPSPTGALHLGNARSFLLAWLSARQQQGQVILRIEDIDSPRVKKGALRQTIEDLDWLGIDWDAGPVAGTVDGSTSCDAEVPPGDPYLQTNRLERYRQILCQFIEGQLVYPCVCSRSEVAAAASAPHEHGLEPLDGQVYPGTCRDKRLDSEELLATDQAFAWRWRFTESQRRWHDQLLGKQSADVRKQLGDFVIAKSDMTPAYQLAVVVDDYDMRVSEVIRGVDLTASTYRQQAILDFLGWPSPMYYHVPLVVGPDGRRLAKRHGDTRLSYLRSIGIAPQQVVGYLAWTLNLLDQPRCLLPEDLIGQLRWEDLPEKATTFEHSTGCEQLAAIK